MAPSRGITNVATNAFTRFSLSQCQTRCISTSQALLSGHSRWSKIKHDKGKADAIMNKQRSIFAHELATASKLYGPEPSANPRLADLITKAKKAGFAKASIEAAIARGQGKSETGAALEAVTVEGLLPNNVAIIVECETSRKAKTIADVRLIIKDNGGTATPTNFLFTRKGRVVLEAKDGMGLEEVMDSAVEAGATDIDEEEDGRIVLSTEPEGTRTVGDAVTKTLDVQIATSEIIWDPNEETMVELPSETAVEELITVLDQLRERETSLQSIALNVARGALDEDAWEALQGRIRG